MPNIILRELELKDLEDYLYRNQPSREFHKFNGPYFKHDTQQELEEKVEKLRERLVNGEKNVLETKKIIADKETDEIIGEVIRYRKSEETLWLEVGIVIFNEKYWGQGIGPQALPLWIDELLAQKPELVRIGLSTRSGNQRMMKLAEKIGLQKEAVYRKARIVEGKYYDSVSYGVLREERENSLLSKSL